MTARSRQPALEARPGPPYASILEIEDWERVRTRLVLSPMHTVVAGLWEIVAGRRRGIPLEWAQTLLRRARGLDLTPFAIYALRGIRLPDFLFAIDPDPTPAFAHQLASLAATPAEVVHADLAYEYGDAIPPGLAAWKADASSALARYCDALGAWWDAVVAPSWADMESALHSEILRVSRLLSMRPPREALGLVHHRVHADERALRVADTAIYERHLLADRRLILVPIVAGPDAVVPSFDNPAGAVLPYAAAGAQALLTGDPMPTDETLQALLGTTRANIVARLAMPGSTTGLARALYLTPPTVSAHLRTLFVMGLVRRTRIGRTVYYERTERAEQLIALYV